MSNAGRAPHQPNSVQDFDKETGRVETDEGAVLLRGHREGQL
jgi:hypothetical protein